MIIPLQLSNMITYIKLNGFQVELTLLSVISGSKQHSFDVLREAVINFHVHDYAFISAHLRMLWPEASQKNIYQNEIVFRLQASLFQSGLQNPQDLFLPTADKSFWCGVIMAVSLS